MKYHYSIAVTKRVGSPGWAGIAYVPLSSVMYIFEEILGDVTIPEFTCEIDAVIWYEYTVRDFNIKVLEYNKRKDGFFTTPYNESFPEDIVVVKKYIL